MKLARGLPRKPGPPVTGGSTVTTWENEVFVMGRNVTFGSPMWVALMGRREGDTVVVQFPHKIKTLRILKIEP